MKKVKFYALCCQNMNHVKRHEKTIPKEDLCIVINTLDQKFEKSAEEYCTKSGIECYVTQSDGTPATGKNELFDIFNSSDNDYAVMIDGDDFLTPHGVWTYKQVAKMETPPDAIALDYQFSLDRNPVLGAPKGMKYDRYQQFIQKYLTDGEPDPELISAISSRPFYHDNTWWEENTENEMSFIKTTAGKQVWDTKSLEDDDWVSEISRLNYKWLTHCKKYIGTNETHHRVVWFSKKASQYYFNDHYVIGEDTLQYFDIKDAHVKGHLNLVHLFDDFPTYVYDRRVEGIVFNETKYLEKKSEKPMYGFYSWLKPLVEAFDRHEKFGKMHQVKIPYLRVKKYKEQQGDCWDIIWPEDYKPDVLSLVRSDLKVRRNFLNKDTPAYEVW